MTPSEESAVADLSPQQTLSCLIVDLLETAVAVQFDNVATNGDPVRIAAGAARAGDVVRKIEEATR